MTKLIYMDHAATTPVLPEVLEAMIPYFSEKFGNPSGVHSVARQAREASDQARADVSEVLGCSVEEVVFTSGGTESDNAALKGVAYALREKGNHIITSAIEHHAILNTCKFLQESGFKVTYLPVDRYGLVGVDELEKAITNETILVSIMLANNEIGTIQPVADLAGAVKKKNKNIVFHTDAVQGVGALDIMVDNLGIDMLSLSAHKFHGPKGVGVLYVRNMTPFIPQNLGGGQESGRRAGTENVAGIVGAATALKIADGNRDSSSVHCQRLRNKIINGLQNELPGVYLNGHPTKRLPNNINLCFKYIEAEAILVNLDLHGVAASSGSACTSGEQHPSHVLSAIGTPPVLARSSLRLTLGLGNTEEDVDYVLSILPGIVQKLRAVSPLSSFD